MSLRRSISKSVRTLWYASLPVYAVYSSLQMTLTDCVFADSVPSGDRVRP